jgi:CubicO group peptidase (beta-lactamase class C family)
VRAAIAPVIHRLIDADEVVGLSLALATGEHILWAEGFGYADRGRGIRATPDTVYQAGSLAKPLTAAAVVLLVERGEIDLDRPVAAYLRGFAVKSHTPDAPPPITIRQLLSHHSGLPTDILKGMWTDAPFTEVVEMLSDESVAYPPDLAFTYSNVGYSILGLLVQHVSHQPFAAYMDAAVIRPLGLEQTGFELTPRLAARLATGYHGNIPLPASPIRDTPALGLYTSVVDLVRFAQALLRAPPGGGPPGVDGRLARRLFEAQNANVPLDLDVRTGLGWFIEENTVPGAGRVARHGGATLLYSGELLVVPDQALAVAVLANRAGSSGVTGYVAEQLVAAVLATRGSPDALPSPPPAGLQASAPLPGPWVEGRYATSLGLLSVDTRQRQLCACIIGQPLGLETHPDGWLGVTAASASTLPHELSQLGRIQFAVRKLGGREVVIGREEGREFLLGERMAEAASPAQWDRRLGRYQVLNPDPSFPLEDLTLGREHGVLCMSYRTPALTDRTVRRPLRPIGENEAVVGGLGRSRGETVRFAVNDDGEETLRFSGYLARRVQ